MICVSTKQTFQTRSVLTKPESSRFEKSSSPFCHFGALRFSPPEHSSTTVPPFLSLITIPLDHALGRCEPFEEVASSRRRREAVTTSVFESAPCAPVRVEARYEIRPLRVRVLSLTSCSSSCPSHKLTPLFLSKYSLEAKTSDGRMATGYDKKHDEKFCPT